MDELADAHDLGITRQTFLEPVFHGLDVVVGAALDGLDGLRIRDREIGDDGVQFRNRTLGKIRAFGKLPCAGKCLEPLDFDTNAIAHEPVFGKVDAQAFYLRGVASIQRRKCGEFVECHGCSRERARQAMEAKPILTCRLLPPHGVAGRGSGPML